MWNGFLYGVRKLRNEKLSSAVFVLLLTLGISTTAVIGGLLNSIALKPLPVTNPGNLFLLSKNTPQQVRPDTSFGYKQFESLRQRKDLFSDAVAEQVWSSEDSPLRLEGASRARLLHALVVSPNYFTSRTYCETWPSSSRIRRSAAIHHSGRSELPVSAPAISG